MCGRFVRHTNVYELTDLLGVPWPDVPPSYNVAPTQAVPVVREGTDGREGVVMTWGLVPSWSKDGKPLINARGETAADKPTFRSAFKTRRCLIPATGYFEWQATDGGKQPWLFRLLGGEPFAFAGLWETWD